MPNSKSEPDYMGWEVKQYGVRDFTDFRPLSPVTLMTPEPDGGYYRKNGISSFIYRFGYADKKGRADRMNFGGVYRVSKPFHADTGLKIVFDGFYAENGRITDFSGCIALVNNQDEVAASWSFEHILQHWNRKHNRAVYVPSMKRTSPSEYYFGSLTTVCRDTDFLYFLSAIAADNVYYDPGLKMENISAAKPSIKRRSQFRVSFRNLSQLYKIHEIYDVKC